MTSSAHSSPSPSNREPDVKEYGPSDGETSLPRRSSSSNGEAETQDEDILSADLEQERGRDDKVGGEESSNYKTAENFNLFLVLKWLEAVKEENMMIRRRQMEYFMNRN